MAQDEIGNGYVRCIFNSLFRSELAVAKSRARHLISLEVCKVRYVNNSTGLAVSFLRPVERQNILSSIITRMAICPIHYAIRQITHLGTLRLAKKTHISRLWLDGYCGNQFLWPPLAPRVFHTGIHLWWQMVGGSVLFGSVWQFHADT